MNRLAQYKAAKTYRAKLNLLAHIHLAIAPILDASRKADAILDGGLGSGMANKEKLPLCERGSLDKYNPEIAGHSMGTLASDLASENIPFACYLSARMNEAQADTYQQANSVAQATL